MANLRSIYSHLCTCLVMHWLITWLCTVAAALRTLNLRQNILKDASDLNNAEFKSTLVDLELRDNLLKEVCLQQLHTHRLGWSSKGWGGAACDLAGVCMQQSQGVVQNAALQGRGNAARAARDTGSGFMLRQPAQGRMLATVFDTCKLPISTCAARQYSLAGVQQGM